MTHAYRPVQWNRNKLWYDLAMIAAVSAFIILFIRLAPTLVDWPQPIDPNQLRIRAYGICAFFLFSLILMIGPLARLDRRFLPLLYNRRHLGVTLFVVVVGHIGWVRDWYLAFSHLDPWTAMLISNTSTGSLQAIPIMWLGLGAAVILFVMAATSHDFINRQFGAAVWKSIHMAVYLAYGLVVAHVAFGYLQTEQDPVLTVIMAGLPVTVAALHLAAAWKERDGDPQADGDADWVPGPLARDLPTDGGGMVFAMPGGERVALFRQDDRIGVLANVCAHQGGPLGEGKILFGCVTCPWHGFQYDLTNGRSPPPFTERIPTYNARLGADGRILIDPTPLPAGTPRPLIDLSEAKGAAP